MQRYKLVVLSNPVEGREDEYNEWYSTTHTRDMLAIPGILAVERFNLAAFQRFDSPQPYRYLAIYEVETDNLENVTGEMRRRSGTPALVVSEAIDRNLLMAMFAPL